MDIQKLVFNAEVSLSLIGTVIPTVHIELERQYLSLPCEWLNDNLSIPSQCGKLARLALEQCKQYPEENVVSIGLVAEAWVSMHPKSDEEKVHPKKDVNRKEVVSIETWTASTRQTELWVFPLVRDGKGQVSGIGEGEKTNKQITYQLASVIQGCKDAKKDEEEVIATLDSAISKQMAMMKPEGRKNLIKFLKQEGIPSSLIEKIQQNL